MKIAVLGTGTVGTTLATKLVELGHDVRLGSRTPDNAAASAWSEATGGSHGTFADAASFADLALLCVSGAHAITVVEAAGDGLDGKVLIDLTNPLDFSGGFPPTLFVCSDDSLAERVQAAAPKARVVKTLNTVANELMVDPGALPEPTDLFVSGDDADAKAVVVGLLKEMGWQDPVDLGPLSSARGTEAWLLLWTRLYAALGTGDFNLKLVRK